MDTNTLIFETLYEISPLKTAKASMFSTDDIYAHPPFLRFKFYDKNVIEVIEPLINNFNGILEWTICKNEKVENNILIPLFFSSFLNKKGFYNKELYVKTIGKMKYENKVNEAIKDIPLLASHIKNNSPLCIL